MKKILTNSLIANYLPADYADSFSQIVVCEKEITPEEFRHFAFNQLPKWINSLMKLRNAIVKPLGLDISRKFTDMICASSPNE